ncbi:MAG: outer membrane beta-barrel protein [Candidatus Eremiobacteraeota bacterium]|nr:outer membrane beta-barrel protein [Candidatus Eremiobacteraeota bacterium]
MRKLLMAAFMLGVLTMSSYARALAQTAPATAASPSPAPSPTATPTPPWTFSGFADITYTKPIPSGGTLLFTNGAPARVFDGITGINTKSPEETSFVFNNLNVNVRKNTSNGLGGQFEASLGSDANVIASYGGSANTYTDITQAYLYYAAGQFTLNAGKYETLAGYEVIESPSDNQISRSILFGFAVPFTHTGARLVWAPSAKISVTGGVNYGWDQIISTQGLNTIEGGVTWNPSSILSFSGDVYSGKEPSVLTPYPTGGTIAPPPGPATIYGQRTLLDLVMHYNPTSLWNFGLNGDIAQQFNDQFFNSAGAIVTNGVGVPLQGTARWSGIAGYAVYNVSSLFTLSARLETFNDQNGVRTGIAQTWNEGTVTVQYAPNGNMKFRLEGRGDWSNVPSFARYTSPLGTSSNNNETIGAEAIFSWP